MGDIGRVRVVLAYGLGAPGLATHFFRVSGDSDWASQKQPILDGVADAWSELVTVFSSALTATVQDEIDIIDEESGELVTTISAEGSGITGTGATGFAPKAVGLCVTWRTNGVVDGHHVRGRTFVVPVGLDMADGDGTPTSGCMTAVEAFGDALIVVDGGSADLVIWSRPRPAREARLVPPRPARAALDGSAYTVTSATVTDTFAVLRSRRD